MIRKAALIFFITLILPCKSFAAESPIVWDTFPNAELIDAYNILRMIGSQPYEGLDSTRKAEYKQSDGCTIVKGPDSLFSVFGAVVEEATHTVDFNKVDWSTVLYGKPLYKGSKPDAIEVRAVCVEACQSFIDKNGDDYSLRVIDAGNEQPSNAGEVLEKLFDKNILYFLNTGEQAHFEKAIATISKECGLSTTN